ncbi:MAG: hypothetical protein HYX51_05320 [Chloroflexi bacterium]|nr:hypothetical protein [Chloroflexota bacterium]
MTIGIVTHEQRLEKIRSTGFWRVIVHPTLFEEQRISSLDLCWQIMVASSVNFRGLPFPSVRTDERRHGTDWVGSGGEFGNGVEAWRLFQSGQFVGEFSVHEDVMSGTTIRGSHQNGTVDPEVRVINFVNILFMMTEILEFARNLAHRDVLAPAAVIRVELHGMKDRRLVAPESMWWNGTYVASDDVIQWKAQLLPIELIAAAPRHALDAALHVFERFGWFDPPRATLERRQLLLLEGRPYSV